MTDDPDFGSRSPVDRGRIVGGALLVLLGTAWLLEIFDVLDFSWPVLLSVALIVIGLTLAATAGSGGAAGLTTLGAIVAGLLVFSFALEGVTGIDLGGGVGDRTITTPDLEARRLAVGSLTVDLRGADLSGDFETSVGIGELVVIVDDATTVDVVARAGLGEVVIFGMSSRGFGPSLEVGGQTAAFRLVASVGIGKVEVRE
jgi:hypothetical protein